MGHYAPTYDIDMVMVILNHDSVAVTAANSTALNIAVMLSICFFLFVCLFVRNKMRGIFNANELSNEQ